jgi:XTP/dITP diphosphohydrolase
MLYLLIFFSTSMIKPTQFILASQNAGKIEEVRMLLLDLPWEVVAMRDAGVVGEAPEDQDTTAGNALQKARYVTEATGQWSFADDTGLFIPALGGEPGVRSARWAGKRVSDEELVAYAVSRIRAIPDADRKAYFETTVALVAPLADATADGVHEWVFSGRVDGTLLDAPVGPPRHHLPYDALFVPEGSDETFAQMTQTQKNRLSHRGRALYSFRQFLTSLA